MKKSFVHFVSLIVLMAPVSGRANSIRQLATVPSEISRLAQLVRGGTSLRGLISMTAIHELSPNEIAEISRAVEVIDIAAPNVPQFILESVIGELPSQVVTSKSDGGFGVRPISVDASHIVQLLNGAKSPSDRAAILLLYGTSIRLRMMDRIESEEGNPIRLRENAKVSRREMTELSTMARLLSKEVSTLSEASGADYFSRFQEDLKFFSDVLAGSASPEKVQQVLAKAVQKLRRDALEKQIDPDLAEKTFRMMLARKQLKITGIPVDELFESKTLDRYGDWALFIAAEERRTEMLSSGNIDPVASIAQRLLEERNYKITSTRVVGVDRGESMDWRFVSEPTETQTNAAVEAMKVEYEAVKGVRQVITGRLFRQEGTSKTFVLMDQHSGLNAYGLLTRLTKYKDRIYDTVGEAFRAVFSETDPLGVPGLISDVIGTYAKFRATDPVGAAREWWLWFRPYLHRRAVEAGVPFDLQPQVEIILFQIILNPYQRVLGAGDARTVPQWLDQESRQGVRKDTLLADLAIQEAKRNRSFSIAKTNQLIYFPSTDRGFAQIAPDVKLNRRGVLPGYEIVDVVPSLIRPGVRRTGRTIQSNLALVRGPHDEFFLLHVNSPKSSMAQEVNLEGSLPDPVWSATIDPDTQLRLYGLKKEPDALPNSKTRDHLKSLYRGILKTVDGYEDFRQNAKPALEAIAEELPAMDNEDFLREVLEGMRGSDRIVLQRSWEALRKLHPGYFRKPERADFSTKDEYDKALGQWEFITERRRVLNPIRAKNLAYIHLRYGLSNILRFMTNSDVTTVREECRKRLKTIISRPGLARTVLESEPFHETSFKRWIFESSGAPSKVQRDLFSGGTASRKPPEIGWRHQLTMDEKGLQRADLPPVHFTRPVAWRMDGNATWAIFDKAIWIHVPRPPIGEQALEHFELYYKTQPWTVESMRDNWRMVHNFDVDALETYMKQLVSRVKKLEKELDPLVGHIELPFLWERDSKDGIFEDDPLNMRGIIRIRPQSVGAYLGARIDPHGDVRFREETAEYNLPLVRADFARAEHEMRTIAEDKSVREKLVQLFGDDVGNVYFELVHAEQGGALEWRVMFPASKD